MDMRAMLLPLTLAVLLSPADSRSQSLETGKPFPHIPLPYIDRSEEKGLETIAGFGGQKTVVHIFAGW